MCENLPVNGFKWVTKLDKFKKDFITNYNENSNAGYFVDVDIEYPKNLHKMHIIFITYLFYLIQKKIAKIEKLICSIEDKEKYVIHINALKQALNHGLILVNVHRVIQFNQEALLEPYIDMNTELRKEAKNDFEKNLFKSTNNSVFGKTMENVRKHRDIKLVTTEKRRLKLVSEPNYHMTKHFSENLIAVEMKKTKIKINKPIYLGASILDISKTLMYKFWYDYLKPKYNDKVKLCYMDTDSFIINLETEDFYKDIANDVERWFDTSNYDKNDKRPLPVGKNKNVVGLFKDELGGNIMLEFIANGSKTYAYLLNDDSETKKAKVKRRLMFENYKDSLFNNKIIMRKQMRFKSDHHDMYTEEINKIALYYTDDKRLQTFDGITTYPYGTNAFKVCESEILTKGKLYD